MKYKIIPCVLFMVAVAVSTKAHSDLASEGHGHKNPHGGIVQEAEGIHAELLIDKTGQPKLYLYDKAMKPFGRGDLQARLVVKGHGGVEHSRGLNVSGNPKACTLFRGEPIKGLKDWDTAVVSVKLKDSWTHFRFSH